MSKAFGSRYSIENSEEAKEYFEFVKDLLDSDVVNEMKNFRHHYSTTCYQHFTTIFTKHQYPFILPDKREIPSFC